MPTYSSEEREALDTYGRYVEVRQRICSGEGSWGDLADFFTEDARYSDPAWGCVRGREDIRRFMEESMAGLDDWDFPEEWTTAAGRLVITQFQNRLPGVRADGRPHQVPGISVLEYAGSGRFSSEVDLINMDHMREVIVASGWRPTGPMNVPPAEPDRG